MQLAELQNKALELHPNEREVLAHALLDSLNEEPATEISQGWLDEIDRRIADVDAGRVTMIPYEQFRAEIREKTGW